MPAPTGSDLEMVIAGYDAIARRDFASMVSLVAPDGVLETRLGTYRGHEHLRRYFEESVPSDMTSTVEAFVVADDRLIALSEVTMVGPHSRIAASEKVAEVCSIEDGLVTRIEVMGRDECIEAFGLAEHADDVGTLRNSYQCYNRGDFDGALEHVHSDVAWNRGEQAVGEPLLHGIDQVKQLLEPEVFDSQHLEVEAIAFRGRRALVIVTFTVTGAGSGIEVSGRGHHVWTMRDRKAERLDFFQEREPAIELLFDDA